MRSVAQNLIASQAVAITPQAVANVSLEGMAAVSVAAERSALAAHVLRGSGGLRLQARGESMLPTLWPGDVVEITRCSVEDVQRGEIVLALREGSFFLHRFVARCEPAGFELRGDSMPAPDPQFPDEAFLGRLTGRLGHGTISEIAAEQARANWESADRGYSDARPVMPLSIWSWAVGRVLSYCGPARRLSLRLHTLFGEAQAGRTASPKTIIDLRVS